jgi:hypothetical protein
MKTNVKLLLAIALLASACTTGLKVTSGGYSDDLYFTPGDAVSLRPVVPKPAKEAEQPQKKSMVAMQVEENEQGKIVNNYVVPKSTRKDNNAYYFEDQPAYSDTTLEYKNDREEVTINNYFEGEEMDYSTRIRAFYNPYFYDPFWDPFWNHGFGYGFGYGYGMGGYYPWGYSMFDPWYGYGGFGYGGYGWGGYGYGFGGYGGYGYGGYGWGGYGYGFGGYGGYGWGGYYDGFGGISYNDKDRYHGKQNHTGIDGGSNAVKYGMNTRKSGSLTGSGNINQPVIGRNFSGNETRLPSENKLNESISGTRTGTAGVGASATRLSGTRTNEQVNTEQTIQGNVGNQGSRSGKGETIINLRRSTSNNIQENGVINQSGSSSRPATSVENYTPTYNKPRMNTQPSYSNGASRQYSSPENSSSGTQPTRYSRPPSTGSSSTSRTVTTQPSSGYERGSVGSSATRSSESRSYNSGSYSAPRSVESSSPSRSYTAPSYNSGSSGSIGVGSSSGGSIGGSSGTRSSGGSSGRQQ